MGSEDRAAGSHGDMSPSTLEMEKELLHLMIGVSNIVSSLVAKNGEKYEFSSIIEERLPPFMVDFLKEVCNYAFNDIFSENFSAEKAVSKEDIRKEVDATLSFSEAASLADREELASLATDIISLSIDNSERIERVRRRVRELVNQ